MTLTTANANGYTTSYMNRSDDLVTLEATGMTNGIEQAKDALRANLVYACDRPMVRVYHKTADMQFSKMVAVVEGRVNSAGQIRRVRVQTAEGWGPWQAL